MIVFAHPIGQRKQDSFLVSGGQIGPHSVPINILKSSSTIFLIRWLSLSINTF